MFCHCRHLACEHPARTRTGCRRMIHWLVLALMFSGLQGGLGAWVVPWMAGGAPVVEVCTPQGRQWVRLDAEVAGSPASQAPATGDRSALQQTLTCVWALALVTLPVASPRAVGMVPRSAEKGVLPGLAQVRPPGEDGPVRVLLMAPMRAPPCRVA